LTHGWGVRPSDWSFGASIQQQLFQRASVEIGYYRRWFTMYTTGGTVTDNLNVGPNDLTPFYVTVPADPRLPDGGGQTIGPLYNLTPTAFALAQDNLVRATKDIGNDTRVFNGVDITFNIRNVKGVTFSGGTSTGKVENDWCDIRNAVPEAFTLNPYCHVKSPLQTSFNGLATYTIPKIDVLLSGTFQSNPGAELSATYAVSSAEAARTLGRPLSNNATSVNVNLIAPRTLYGDRINQLDFRIAKLLKFGRTRTNVGVDLYNALNSNAVQTYNATFVAGSGTWPTPTLIMPARFIKLSAQVDF